MAAWQPADYEENFFGGLTPKRALRLIEEPEGDGHSHGPKSSAAIRSSASWRAAAWAGSFLPTIRAEPAGGLEADRCGRDRDSSM